MTPLDGGEARARLWFQRTIALSAALILGAIGLVFGFAAQASHDRCAELQDVRQYILEATERGLNATPDLSYYKEHPDELKTAMENLRAQRDEFRDPLDCSVF